MVCERIVFTGHALRRMFERAVSHDAVVDVIEQGETIASYPDDQPYPSRLLLAFVEDRALHVVVAMDEQTSTCHVVTVYDPDPEIWEPGFKRRKPS